MTLLTQFLRSNAANKASALLNAHVSLSFFLHGQMNMLKSAIVQVKIHKLPRKKLKQINQIFSLIPLGSIQFILLYLNT